jgi:hypothetical protein
MKFLLFALVVDGIALYQMRNVDRAHIRLSLPQAALGTAGIVLTFIAIYFLIVG